MSQRRQKKKQSSSSSSNSLTVEKVSKTLCRIAPKRADGSAGNRITTRFATERHTKQKGSIPFARSKHHKLKPCFYGAFSFLAVISISTCRLQEKPSLLAPLALPKFESTNDHIGNKRKDEEHQQHPGDALQRFDDGAIDL